MQRRMSVLGPRRLGALALGVGAVAAVLATTDARRVLEVASRVGPLPVLALAVLYLPTWWIRGLRWRAMAADLGDDIPWRWAVAASTAGNLLNIVLPAKTGDLLWANAARARLGIPFLRAATGVLAGRVVDLGVLLALGLAGAALVPGLPRGVRIGAAAGAGLAVLAWWPLRLVLERLARRTASPRPATRALAVLAGPAARMAAAPGASRHLASTAALWLLEAAVAWGIALAMELPVGYPAALLAVMVANLSKIVPITPASLGTYEAAGAAVLAATGLPYAEGVALCLVEHGLKLAVNILLGLAVLATTDLPLLDVDADGVRRRWKALLAGEPGP